MSLFAIGISLIIIVASVLFKPVTSEESSSTPLGASKPTREESYNFQYPGSKSDGVDKITNWYKEKIKGEGYNATSFVTTKTNGKVLNKLAGVKAGSKVEVVISQSNTSSPVEISINFE